MDSKIVFKIDTENYKKPEDKGNDSWKWTGTRCSLCKEDVYVDYYDRNNGHELIECLKNMARRIEELEKKTGISHE
jgi:hypothetical protein